MKVLFIEKTYDTPEIMLNQKDGIFEIAGRSLPEDAVGFYNPVIDWISEYAKSPNPATELTLKLEYCNSASSKLILKVLQTLAPIKGTKVVWYSPEEDEELEEDGRELSQDVNIPFEFRTY